MAQSSLESAGRDMMADMMKTAALGLKRAYRLTPDRGPADGVVSLVRIDGPTSSKTVLLPYSVGLDYIVLPTGATDVAITGKDFHAERLGLLSSLWARLRLALLFKEKKFLKHDEFSVFSVGPKPQRKRFTTFNQDMLKIGVGLDRDLIASHPEVLAGWSTDDSGDGAASRHRGLNPVAVVVHIYYDDTWPDIAGALKRLSIPFDLIVTTVPGREHLIEAVRRDFPHADIETIENRGRDVRPFLALLERGRLDRYRYVCKVHGKKSTDGGRKSYMGAMWRRRLLFDLLAAPGLADSIVERFERDPLIGMIGPRAFRMPSELYSEDFAWSGNRLMVLELSARMGVPAERFRLDFFGGTMFWVRPEALKPLRDLRLSSVFPEEQGQLDGGLEHATERLFATSVVAAGYRLANSDGPRVSDDGGPRTVLEETAPVHPQ
jgi:Rhamnan synthesis protein F